MKAKSFMNARFISILIAMLSFLMISVNSFAQKPNFSGTFNLNESKSNIGQGPMRPAFELIVTQDDNSLAIQRKSKGRDGEDRVQNLKYTLDGKECENQGFMNSVSKSVVNWSADQKTLTINTTTVMDRNGEKIEMKSTEIWSLSTDGSTMTLDVNRSTPNGEIKQTLVYDKAK
jgi:hypothetical protein